MGYFKLEIYELLSIVVSTSLLYFILNFVSSVERNYQVDLIFGKLTVISFI
ncbi:hypothetical protein [Clostridium fallax]|uniref:hypothetical protein n=1 Tax=Clostridium fallax TaxID=1533 RepID=UPI0013567052|nr:hypothetical protein [Clostridium fallax]